uniref:C3H1-type domain-containing protein n=1 Tax=Alexandrium monilatum TaxID=311494 RepID=A0A7S4Q595_9DINO
MSPTTSLGHAPVMANAGGSDVQSFWLHRKSSASGASCNVQSYKLSCKSTFLDVGSEADGSLSPRALSDPGTVTVSLSSRSRLDWEERYVSELSEQMSQIWASERSQVWESEMSHVWASERPCGSASDGHSPPPPEESRAAACAMPMMPPSAAEGGGRLDGMELRSRISSATEVAERSLDRRCRRAVLEAIHEIPEQVADALQQRAGGIVSGVLEEVGVVRDMIEEDGAAAGRTGLTSAVAKLEAIPEMVQESFEARFSEAERTVRSRVDGVMANLEASGLSRQEVVERISTIPGEVQEIAAQAMQVAVAESRVQAQQQLNFALASLPKSGARRFAGMAGARILPQVSVDLADLARGAKDAAAGTVEHAVAVVEKEDRAMHVVANQMVAETLLRAKMDGKSSRDFGLEGLPPTVPGLSEGSHWSPQLCGKFQGSGGPDLDLERPPPAVPVLNKGSHGSPQLCAEFEGTGSRSFGLERPPPAAPDLSQGSCGHPQLGAEFQVSGSCSCRLGGPPPAAPGLSQGSCGHPQLGAELQVSGSRSFGLSRPLPTAPGLGQGSHGSPQLCAEFEVSGRCSFGCGGGPPAVLVPSVGSCGHPELCSRPCLYFARGECANGSSCDFCHLEHSKRPVHPDKRNRQLLGELSFSETLSVAAPVIREKIEELGLGPRALRPLDELAAAFAGEEEPTVPGRRRKQLQDVMRSMLLRSVVALLQRAARTDGQRESIDGFFWMLRAAPLCL